jgi:guanylate cyclase
LLPASVAQDLKNGISVPPRMYAGATVLFTDICGFTSLCSVSTPMQVVAMLNLLFGEFDAIVSVADAYKVPYFSKAAREK